MAAEVHPRTVRKGDRYAWRGPDGGSYGDAAADVYLLVTRVAKDGSWADIRCHTWAVGWSRRHKLPLLMGCVPYEWGQDDLDAQELAWMSKQ